MRGAERRVLVVVLAAVLAVVGTSVVTWWVRRPVPVVVDPACPALLKHTNDAAEDFGDTVTWAGRTYWSTPGRAAEPGVPLGSVTCSVITDLGDHGWRTAPGAWPDGAATVLPRGTSLCAPLEDATGRALVARTEDGDRLYCVEDDATGAPGC